jgi:hypothetical protein
MLKICVRKWDENQSRLREVISKSKKHNTWDYKDLVKLTFDTIFNDCEKLLDTDEITEIDNGDYQGTLIYLIPFNTYQPSEYQYLMTYVGYGSCSGCDTLQGIQRWDDKLPTEMQVSDYMTLCKDIITNTIRPYNSGWRHDADYDTVEEF